jgi:hypothetical protein
MLYDNLTDITALADTDITALADRDYKPTGACHRSARRSSARSAERTADGTAAHAIR